MKTWLLLAVTWLAGVSAVFAQTTTTQAFEDAKAFGKGQIAGTKGKISNSTGTSNVPFFGNSVGSTTQYFGSGQGATSGPGTNKMMACDTNPATGTPYQNQECDAVNFIAKSPGTRPQMPISKQDPIITEGSRITSTTNIGSILGTTSSSLSGTYSNCTPQTVTTPAQFETVHCDKTDNQDDMPCAQSLNVEVTTTTVAANQNFSCNSGTYNGSNCVTVTTSNPNINYSCSTGTILDSNCINTITSPAAITYDCPVPTGGLYLFKQGYRTYASLTYTVRVLGSNACYYFAGGSWANYGSALSSQFGITATSINQDYGQFEAGTTARATYSCPAGSVASGSAGSQCTSTTTTAAIQTQYCPQGVLANSVCSVTSTASPIVTYSCTGGSTNIGSTCVTKTLKQAWVSSCTPYETAAGMTLGAP